jgi:nucleotide-binding universal stress UspA family protein
MDLSNRNSNAFNHARQIADRHAAKIDVIHVIPMWKYFNESLQHLSIPLDSEEGVYPHLQEQASGKLKELMDRYLTSETKGKAVLRISHNPSRVSAQYAEMDKYDLIVMGRRKYSADLLSGNITEKVLHHSSIPVLHTDASDSETDVIKDAVPA